MWFWDGHEHVDPSKEATYPPTRRVASRDAPKKANAFEGKVAKQRRSRTQGPARSGYSGAQEKRLANNTTTLAAEYAKQGKDWETELRQRAKEKNLMDELGLSPPEAAPQTKNGKEDDEGDE